MPSACTRENAVRIRASAPTACWDTPNEPVTLSNVSRLRNYGEIGRAAQARDCDPRYRSSILLSLPNRAGHRSADVPCKEVGVGLTPTRSTKLVSGHQANTVKAA